MEPTGRKIIRDATNQQEMLEKLSRKGGDTTEKTQAVSAKIIPAETTEITSVNQIPPNVLKDTINKIKEERMRRRGGDEETLPPDSPILTTPSSDTEREIREILKNTLGG